MRILQSSINMKSNYKSETITEKQETLRVWDNREKGSANSKLANMFSRRDYFEHSEFNSAAKEDFREKLKALKDSFKPDITRTKEIMEPEEIELQLSEKDKMTIRIFEEALSAVTGKKIKFIIPKKILVRKDDLEAYAKSQDAKNLRQRNTQSLQGWGIDYRYRESHFEEEQLSFNANGKVKTADGLEIDFKVDLNMSRSFYSEKNITFKAGDALIDPLVINFGGKAAELQDTKFHFDLDADGREDNISFLKEGSGFLAIDSNEDGKINDGSELFGPKTDDGFGELSCYDEDKNNWIDENDPIFNKLRIWTKDSEGNDKLWALGEKGIGAIYLGNVDTKFSLNNADNKQLGTIKNTGIYVCENGRVGTVQEIDVMA